MFFAVGFETTAPANAMAVYQAHAQGLTNFSLLVSHVLVPPAMEAILASPVNRVQGFLAAGHVCTVMGYTEYEPIAAKYRVPIVVTGFEPLDLLHGVYLCVKQLEEGRAEVENQYARAVQRQGNTHAQDLVRQVFRVVPRKWRGVGEIPQSGLALQERFSLFDAEMRFGVADLAEEEPTECISGLILQGSKKPHECPAFGDSLHARNIRLARRWFPPKARVQRTTGTAASSLSSRSMAAERGVGDAAGFSCPIPIAQYPHVLLGHGGGGQLMHQLIEKMFVPAFSNPRLDARHDGAVFETGAGRLAFTTDSYVVRPLFFPGGDIGTLAVNGTVNDLAMCGARARFLSAGFILEEGLPMETLWRIVQSMQRAARDAGVELVTGDTKVVDRGKGDGVFINTAGIGIVSAPHSIAPASVQPGDAVLVSGDLGRHGMAIMAVRENLSFESAIESDCAPLVEPVMTLLEEGIDVHCLRDLTRGGLASALVEIAEASQLSIAIDETLIPVREDVRGACEILGLRSALRRE